MTRNKRFKDRVRARMARTGERYSTARAHVLATLASAADSAGGHPYRPGLCRDTAAVANALAARGVRLGPDGPPVDEITFYGLCGGTGFLYMVFEYRGFPPLPSVLMRHDTAADRFFLHGLRRLGLGLEVRESSSAARARRDLDAALAAGHPAFCVVDAATLHRGGLPGAVAGLAPTAVAVTGKDGDGYVLDTGAGRPERRTAEELDAARAACRSTKRRLAVLRDVDAVAEPAAALHEAVAATAERYERSPYRGFAGNFGLAGMAKFVAALTDTRDRRGWPRLFPEGRLACLGLRRLYQGVQLEMTPPAGGRGAQATFLRTAAEVTGHAPYVEAAERFERAAAAWTSVADHVAGCGVREVAMGCELLDAYAELLDDHGGPEAAREASEAIRTSADGSDLGAAEARALFAEVAERAERASSVERDAVAALTLASAEVRR